MFITLEKRKFDQTFRFPGAYIDTIKGNNKVGIKYEDENKLKVDVLEDSGFDEEMEYDCITHNFSSYLEGFFPGENNTYGITRSQGNEYTVELLEE